MSHRLREFVALPIAPALGKRPAAGGEDNRARQDRAARRGQLEPLRCALEGDDARVVLQHHANVRGLREQPIEDIARAVRVREELPICLLVQRHADLLEEVDRGTHWKRAQDTTDDRAAAAPEIALRDPSVGHVATRAAAHEDLGAWLLRAFQHEDREGGSSAAGEDRRGEAGGPAADDRHVDNRLRRLRRLRTRSRAR